MISHSMSYSRAAYPKWHAHVQISSVAADAGHHFVIVSLSSVIAPFQQQLQWIRLAFHQAMIDILPPSASTVFQRYFLSDAINQAPLIFNEDENNQLQCATSVIGQTPLCGGKVALFAYLVDNAVVTRHPDGLVSAAVGEYTQWWATCIAPDDNNTYDAALKALNRLDSMLAEHGLSIANNCQRTWFFVNDIDHRYPGLVTARNNYFSGIGLTPDTHFIASTGIEGTPAYASSKVPAPLLMLDAFAIQADDYLSVSYPNAPTHLNLTHSYGVAFERSTVIDFVMSRHLIISGTASIDANGHILYPNDIIAQTLRMLDNVQALLSAASCQWSNVTHAIVYIRDSADYQAVLALLADRIPQIPFIILNAPVCRPGWLIEMECSAIKDLK